MSKDIYDVIIVGGGPAGLSASIYAVRAGLNSIVLEDNPYGCGQISLTEQVDNYPGLVGINGFDLGDKFSEHAKSLGAVIEQAKVTKIEKTGPVFEVTAASGKVYKSNYLVAATGAKHKHLGIKGEDTFQARGVSYCALCDASFYKNKTVAVVGGGDTALGDAVTLSKVATKVYIVHRRDEFRASASLVNKVKNIGNIELVLKQNPVEIKGTKTVEELVCTSVNLKVDGVFVAIGEAPESGLLEGLVDFDKGGYVLTDVDCKTKTENLFAIGDVRAKRVRQVTTAVADGAIAITAIS